MRPSGPALRHQLVLPNGSVHSSGSGTGGSRVLTTTFNAGRHYLRISAVDGTSTTSEPYRIVISAPSSRTGIAMMPTDGTDIRTDPASSLAAAFAAIAAEQPAARSREVGSLQMVEQAAWPQPPS